MIPQIHTQKGQHIYIIISINFNRINPFIKGQRVDRSEEKNLLT